MNSAHIVMVIAFVSECSGKYLEDSPLDLFMIQKSGQISATCESNQIISECDENLEYVIDGNSDTFWRGPSLMNGNEFHEVNLTFNFHEVMMLKIDEVFCLSCATVFVQFLSSKNTTSNTMLFEFFP